MSEETRDGIIVEERQRLVGYIGQTGMICLKQEGHFDDSVIVIHANDVDAVIQALADLREEAAVDSTLSK